MEKLEHIGIAVKNLSKSNQLFAKLLGREPYKTEDVPAEGVRTSFFDVGGIKIELLEATRADSPIAKFIENRGEGLHHLAFAVDPIEEKMKEFSDAGFHLLSDKPKPGADNKMIVFMHPKATNNVLVELCQDRNPDSPDSHRDRD
jgi:methylmalonyl-CoA/ethylmalonyl-CoA epimerase